MQYAIECAAITVTPGVLILVIGGIAWLRNHRKEQRRASRMEFNQVRRFIFYRG